MKKMKACPKPDIILVTHTHGDHLNPEMVGALKTNKTIVLGPKAVTDQLSYGTTILNKEIMKFKSVEIKAIAAYNTTYERKNFHPKG